MAPASTQHILKRDDGHSGKRWRARGRDECQPHQGPRSANDNLRTSVNWISLTLFVGGFLVLFCLFCIFNSIVDFIPEDHYSFINISWSLSGAIIRCLLLWAHAMEMVILLITAGGVGWWMVTVHHTTHYIRSLSLIRAERTILPPPTHPPLPLKYFRGEEKERTIRIFN